MPTPPPDIPRLPPADRFRPTSRRQRLVIIAVTAATIVGLWMLLWRPPGPKPPPRSEPAACRPGQTVGCVGGTAPVLVVPASNAASR